MSWKRGAVTADRWQQVSKIYHAALECDGRDRGAFVREACEGDEALQREVESLLAYGPVAQSLIERPAAALAAPILESSLSERSGQQFGPYTIESWLDAGGMGDVYRARDTKLGRDVAMKILPPEFIADADRRARFEREARLLAALNHPHIAQIYGLEESGGVQALVMELVPGDTLAEIIQANAKSGRALALNRALDLGRQIADALAAAHEKGIIHRDLKPANIKVTPDGSIKVLDFGLAKPIVGDAASPDRSELPAATVGGTREGVIVGTPAYMSPEQACGNLVDKRTDIWAFGCVLYEMLTGRRAFEGQDLTDTLAAIVRGEPDLNALPPETPAPIRRLLERCLQKERQARVADVAAVQFALDEARYPISTTAAAPSASVVAKARVTWRDPLMAIGVLILVSGAVGLVWWWRTPAALPETRLEISTPAGYGTPRFIAISPDATQIAFVAVNNGKSMLWLRPLNATGVRPLAGTENATFPFWSPNSQSIGFIAQQQLRTLDLAGGGVQTIADADNFGAAWSPSNVILYRKAVSSELWRMPASSGTATVATRLSGGLTGFADPQFLPDGRHFICFATGAAEVQGLYLGSLDNASVKRLTDADSGGKYIPPGWIAYVRQGTLVARRLDLKQEKLADEIVPIAENVVGSPVGPLSGASVSTTGVIAYRQRLSVRRQLTWFHRSGTPLGTLGPVDNSIDAPALSPDGRRVAVRRTVQGVNNIWVIDESLHMTRVTSDPSGDWYPLWSPNGARIAFFSRRQGKWAEWVKSASGTGPEDLLADGPTPTAFNGMSDWSRDGNYILVDKSPADIWVIPVGGNGKPFPFIDGTPTAERVARFSPNGKWVAYQSNETGRAEIYVCRFPGCGEKLPISMAGGAQPSWSNDGKELYWIAPDGSLMAATVTKKADSIEPAAPVILFPTRILLGGSESPSRSQYAVARDGRFLINTVVGNDAVAPIIVIHNWRGK